MKLHPLINKDSVHYEAEGKPAIELLEEQLTVVEMIGFCRGNIFKYKYRADHKGQKESDMKKIETYENYLKLLETTWALTLGAKSVKDALEELGIKLKYR